MLLHNQYRQQIQKLDMLILNWNMLSESKESLVKFGDSSVELNQGLCSNADLFLLDSKVLNDMFESWEDFSGYLAYPVGTGIQDAYSRYNDQSNKFQDVERLRLAKHCRAYLLKKGEPENTETMLEKFFSIGWVSASFSIAIILAIVYACLGGFQ